MRWIEESYQSPETFWRTIFDFFTAKNSLQSKSFPYEHYDLYHDLIICNIERTTPAFTYYKDNTWQDISYSQLDLEVEHTIATWMSQGVEKEQNICTILPVGKKFLVSLLAALKMGVQFSCLPPLGKHFLKTRLTELGPDFIVTDYIYIPLIKDFEEAVLQEDIEITVTPEEYSHTYISGTTFGNLFDPLSQNTHIPKSVLCDDIYLKAIRDGILTFSLKGGDTFIAPGFHLLQYQPALLLTTLLHGATYIHLELDDFENNANILDGLELNTIGVTIEFIKILLKHEKKLQCNLCFRNIAGSASWEHWTRFFEEIIDKKTPVCNILYRSIEGGAVLFSRKFQERLSTFVYPAPGTKWLFSALPSPGQQSFDNFGLYYDENHLEEDNSPVVGIILIKIEDKYLYNGLVEQRKEGRTYPAFEITEVIKNFDFVNDSIIVSSTTSQANTCKFTLVIFTGYIEEEFFKENKDNWATEILNSIDYYMGKEFLPDMIEFYPLYPKKEEDETDYKWCKLQYTKGMLHKKSKDNITKTLTQLRSLLSL